MKKSVTTLAGAAGAAAVLGVLAGPAVAGVSGAGGGTTTITVDQNSTYTDRTVSSNREYLTDIIQDRGHRTVSSSTSSHWSYQTHSNNANGRQHGWSLGQVINQWSTHDGSSSWYTFLRTSTELASDTKVGEYYTQIGTTFDRTESTAKTSGSDDLIVIGDEGYLQSQYTAQGTRDVAFDVEHYFWNDLNRTDIHQKVFNRYQDHQYNQIDYYTWHTEVAGYVSPIVLDMDGTGTLMASNGDWLPHEQLDTTRLAVFDFYGTGEVKLMEWVGPKDGLLCVPKADGSVDGTCLFGIANGYADGYEELAATRDLNRDGQVSGAELEGLFVWQDGDGNAAADRGELVSVQDAGITRIGVDHKNFKGSFVMGGRELASWDWWPSLRGLRKIAPPRQG